MAKLQKFSEVAKDGCCPKCGYAIMKRGATEIEWRGSVCLITLGAPS